MNVCVASTPCAVTVTPGRTPPCSSLTVPEMLPPWICANAVPAVAIATPAERARRSHVFISCMFLLRVRSGRTDRWSIRCATARGRSGHRPDCSEAGIVSGLRQRRNVRSLRDHNSLNRAIQRTSTLSAARHRPKARIIGGTVFTRVEAGERGSMRCRSFTARCRGRRAIRSRCSSGKSCRSIRRRENATRRSRR